MLQDPLQHFFESMAKWLPVESATTREQLRVERGRQGIWTAAIGGLLILLAWILGTIFSSSGARDTLVGMLIALGFLVVWVGLLYLLFSLVWR